MKLYKFGLSKIRDQLIELLSWQVFSIRYSADDTPTHDAVEITLSCGFNSQVLRKIRYNRFLKVIFVRGRSAYLLAKRTLSELRGAACIYEAYN